MRRFSNLATILMTSLISFFSGALQAHEDLAEFKEGTVWQSIVVSRMGELSIPGVSKKWVVSRATNGTLVLKERTQLSIGKDDLGNPVWISASIPLNNTFECQTFTNMPFPISAPIRKLPGSGYIVTFEMGFVFDVLLVPSTAKTEKRQPSRSIGVFEAPMDKSLQSIGSINYSNGFLHHSAGKKVFVDPSVPERFLNSIDSVVSKWNQGFGRKVYGKPIVMPVNVRDCLSKLVLCINWQGSAESFAWIGWGGIAALSFDPEDGSLIGGLVTIQNLRGPEKLSETPGDVTAIYRSGKISPQFFASLMLRKEEFKKYRHPFENSLFESLLMHEIGHTNGLRHDFSASLDGVVGDYSSSIMDYLPFPTAFLVVDLKHRDVARLQAIYRGRPYAGYDGCSDEMEQAGLEVNCAKGDWGRSESWYIDIVNGSFKGVFETVVEYFSGLPNRDYLSIFAQFFGGSLTTETQQKSVREFLCDQKDRDHISRELQKRYRTDLRCENSSSRAKDPNSW